MDYGPWTISRKDAKRKTKEVLNVECRMYSFPAQTQNS